MSNTDDLKNRLADRQQPGSAVEKSDGKPASAAEMVRRAIDLQTAAFKAVLPSGQEADRFGRLVLTAVKASPQLMECFGTTQGQTSLLLAAMQAASVGLEPNTPTQDCWLLPRRAKGVMECQLSIGYRGLLKLARRSGSIKTIFAEVVHEKDVFHWSRGLEEDELEHVPFDGPGDAGPLTHVYAIARYKEGGYSFIVLNRAQVENRRAQSDSFKNGATYSPWTKWPDAMWRKTALRALVPYLELQTEDARAVAHDEVALRFMPEDGVIDVDQERERAALGEGSEESSAPRTTGTGSGDDGASPSSSSPASDDPADKVKARKSLMAHASKAWPLDDLAPKDRAALRDVMRHAVAFCELGEHKSASDMSIVEMRRVEARLLEVESGAIAVAVDNEGSTVSVQAHEQAPIVVAFDQIGAV